MRATRPASLAAPVLRLTAFAACAGIAFAAPFAADALRAPAQVVTAWASGPSAALVGGAAARRIDTAWSIEIAAVHSGEPVMITNRQIAQIGDVPSRN